MGKPNFNPTFVQKGLLDPKKLLEGIKNKSDRRYLLRAYFLYPKKTTIRVDSLSNAIWECTLVDLNNTDEFKYWYALYTKYS